MTKNEIVDSLKDLQTWAKDVQNQVSAAGNDVIAEATFTPLGHDDRVQRFVRLLEPDPITFEDFIHRIGRGLVSAQELLDLQSAAYLASTSGKPHILPSIFRVPKISADMKFALDVDKERGLNLLFFSKRDQTESRNEQAISFEVVSVPAPPGAADLLLATGPAMDLVLDPVLRGKIIEGVISAPVADDTGPLVSAANDPKLSLRIVSLAFSGASGQPPRFLLFHATPETDKSVGVWLLTMADKNVLTLQTIYKFTTTNSKTEKILRDLIIEIGNRFEKLSG
jgi:hypothetical protein